MKRFLLFLSLSLPTLVNAQTSRLPDYYADLVKGEVMLRQKGEHQRALKQFDLLYADDTLFIRKKGAEVTIANRKSQFVILNGVGAYRVGSLDSKLLKQSHGVMEKYIHLVWEELLHPGKDYSSFKAENMGTWGGVTRGLCTTVKFPFLNMQLWGDTVTFKWQSDGPGITYDFVLRDAKGKILVMKSIMDTLVTIPVNEFLKDNTMPMSWSVEDRDESCLPLPVYQFTLMKKEYYLTRIGEIANGKSAMDAAGALEKEGFYDAAAEYIVKAVKD